MPMNDEQRLLLGVHTSGLSAMYFVLDRLALNLEMTGQKEAAQEVREVCAHVNLGVVRLEALAETEGKAREANSDVPR